MAHTIIHSKAFWFSLGTPVSSTNKTDRHDIAEILLKVALSTIIPPPFHGSVDNSSVGYHDIQQYLILMRFFLMAFLCKSLS